MNVSERLKKIPPYLFAEIDRKIAEAKAQGKDVISFCAKASEIKVLFLFNPL